MSHLRKEIRMDKNQRLVTRYVKDEDGSSGVSEKLSGVAPVLKSTSPQISYKRSLRATSTDAHRPGNYDKTVRTSTDKLISLAASDVPEGTDAASLNVRTLNLSDIPLTPSEEAEVAEVSRVFAHEVAAIEAGKSDSIAVEAELVPVGAFVNLSGCAYVDTSDWEDHSFEYAEVNEVERGPDGEIVLHTDQGSVALPPDYILPVPLEQLNDTIADTYSENDIEAMTQSALDSALEDARYSERDEAEDEEDGGEAYLEALDVENVSPQTYQLFRERVERFVSENAWAISASGRNPTDLGHDFYMTASHSGVGFTDRDDIPSSVRNALASSIYKNDKVYSFEHGSIIVGDDNKVYFE